MDDLRIPHFKLPMSAEKYKFETRSIDPNSTATLDDSDSANIKFDVSSDKLFLMKPKSLGLAFNIKNNSSTSSDWWLDGGCFSVFSTMNTTIQKRTVEITDYNLFYSKSLDLYSGDEYSINTCNGLLRLTPSSARSIFPLRIGEKILYNTTYRAYMPLLGSPFYETNNYVLVSPAGITATIQLFLNAAANSCYASSTANNVSYQISDPKLEFQGYVLTDDEYNALYLPMYMSPGGYSFSTVAYRNYQNNISSATSQTISINDRYKYLRSIMITHRLTSDLQNSDRYSIANTYAPKITNVQVNIGGLLTGNVLSYDSNALQTAGGGALLTMYNATANATRRLGVPASNLLNANYHINNSVSSPTYTVTGTSLNDLLGCYVLVIDTDILEDENVHSGMAVNSAINIKISYASAATVTTNVILEYGQNISIDESAIVEIDE